MSLWIDGEEVASRVDKALDGNSAKVEIGAHLAETQGAMAPGVEGRNSANLAKASAVVGDDETDPQIDDVADLI